MKNPTRILALLATVALQLSATADEATNPVEKIDGFTNTPMEADGKWHVHDPARPQPPVVTPGATFSHGAPAPADAEILFDGHGLAKWINARGVAANWKTNDDYVETAPLGGGIRTRGKWADFQLHVEWASPNPPRMTVRPPFQGVQAKATRGSTSP